MVYINMIGLYDDSFNAVTTTLQVRPSYNIRHSIVHLLVLLKYVFDGSIEYTPVTHISVPKGN